MPKIDSISSSSVIRFLYIMLYCSSSYTSKRLFPPKKNPKTKTKQNPKKQNKSKHSMAHT